MVELQRQLLQGSLIIREHLLTWDAKAVILMAWKDSNLQRAMEENDTGLSYRPKSAVEQNYWRAEMANTLSKRAVSINTPWPHREASPYFLVLKGSCADVDQHLLKIKY